MWQLILPLEQAWSKRQPIAPELRQHVQCKVASFQEDERNKRGYLPGIDVEPGVRAAINRQAIRRALEACRLLEVRRGRIALPFTP
ncbi:MAG TPA: hypothetical protein VGP72_21270 [Planctomycetota bacterium]|jgi:hypothetical protein